ncbi:hypothetical protein ACU21_04150 [Actinobaculum suis]|nr:hypothetical protein ACU21_04150 [Actinobaculum suis]
MPLAGKGFLVASDSGVLFLPHAEPTQAAELWRLLHDGPVGFASVLGELLRLPNSVFALAAPAGETTLVVTRGMRVWDISGTIIADGAQAFTWTETRVPAGTELYFGEEPMPAQLSSQSNALPLTDGVVQAGGAILSFAPVAEAQPAPQPGLADFDQIADFDQVLSGESPTPGAATPAESGAGGERPGRRSATWIAADAAGAAVAATAGAGGVAGAGAVDPTGPTLAFDTGRLGLLIFFVDPARNAGAEQNATGGAGSTYDEADSFTDSQEMLRGPEWTVELRGDVVIGRQPRGQARPGHEAPQLVMVPSPALEISRVHCEVRVDGNEAVIVDRDSNNGTYVLRAGTEPMRVAPESPVLLHDGDIIDIGEGVRFEVAYGI